MKSLLTCLVAGSQYLLHPEKLGTIQETIKPDVIVPVTVLDTHEIFGNVDATLRRFARRDDVFVPDFGFVLIEKPPPPSANASTARRDVGGGGRRVYRLMADEEPAKPHQQQQQQHHDGGGLGLAALPSGPYFLHGPNLYQAWRLYDDEADAFSVGVVPENVTTMTGKGDTDGGTSAYRALGVLSASGANKAIAVPSRLYHAAPTRDRPLSGLRMAVPDVTALAGVATTVSSRAWAELAMDHASATAPLVRRLVELGAVVVGKTKSAQLGAGREWVDAPAPWNPRGDGYQRAAGGGGAGAAAAVAGYRWLRAVYGLDGLANAVEAAAAAASHGLYTLRTTPGLIPLASTRLSAPSYDSVALLGRDLPGLLNTASAVLDREPPGSDPPLPRRIVFVTDAHADDASPEQRRLTTQFVRTLEVAAGVRAERVNVTAAWARRGPREAQGQALDAYLGQAAFRSYCYEYYHAYADFRTAYEDRFRRGPYLEPTPRFQWQTGKAVTASEYEAYRHRVGVFRKWFADGIMASNGSRSADDAPWTAVVLPATSQTPDYRDDAPRAPSATRSLSPEVLALMLGTPQLSVPFAQLPYESRISGRNESGAVVASVLAPAGGDMLTAHFVQRALDGAGWRTDVAAGSRAFLEGWAPGDDVERPGRVIGDPDEL